MSDPFLAEIRIMGFNFPPSGYAQCDGQLLPINQNTALFSLVGTTYGGDGQSTFALPDLRGRTPIHKGNGHNLGQKSGAESHALTNTELPAHGHDLVAANAGADTPIPVTGALAAHSNGYRIPDVPTSLAAGSISNSGSNQSHNNMQPFQSINFCIALIGTFPSPT